MIGFTNSRNASLTAGINMFPLLRDLRRCSRHVSIRLQYRSDQRPTDRHQGIHQRVHDETQG